MFASRIGSATATIASGARTSAQRPNLASDIAPTAGTASGDSRASFVARGVLTSPEYTTRVLGSWVLGSWGTGEPSPEPGTQHPASPVRRLRPTRPRPSSL